MENLAFYLSLLTHHNAFTGGGYRYKEILQRTNKQEASDFAILCNLTSYDTIVETLIQVIMLHAAPHALRNACFIFLSLSNFQALMLCKMLTHSRKKRGGKIITNFYFLLRFGKWDIKMSEQAKSDEISWD